ncbi:MAG: histidine kinase [Ilumatobacteraceae bacterium]|nr:histidine kinase [Ilumatobacteraceae bacterium]
MYAPDRAYTGTMNERSTHPSGHSEATVSIAAGPIAALLAAGLLGRVRSDVGSTNVAVVLATIVVIAALAGRITGIVTAMTAAVSYNYFHTAPYHSLRINGGRDILTVVLLAVLGLIVSELSAWRRRNTVNARRLQESAHSLEDVVGMIATGADAGEVRSVVEATLTEALGLRECRFEPLDRQSPVSSRYVLPRSGSLVSPSMHVGIGGFELPESGAAIEVVNGTNVFGHLVLVPDSRHGSNLESRRAAIALADLLGLAMAAGAARPVKVGAAASR